MAPSRREEDDVTCQERSRVGREERPALPVLDRERKSGQVLRDRRVVLKSRGNPLLPLVLGRYRSRSRVRREGGPHSGVSVVVASHSLEHVF